ncbi:MAG TPA: NapC/NirT family cytochrome c [Burkholderiales bacterium]|nr:NapC/NirT family cytochrome c [Burkholderiales bacterium]
MNGGLLARIWKLLTTPSSRWSLGTLLVAGGVGGILFWGGFNWSLEITNTEKFCISCHEMRNTVYQELTKTIHFSNRTGVRATCPDCHVPKEWFPKIIRKIKASNELLHKMLGTIDTPEKFEKQRKVMAERVWAEMKANDSHECRNCHNFNSMDFSKQKTWSAPVHQSAMKEGQTCIDCHKGIAHKLPAM